jgi:signal transduction histidine kinase
MPPFRPRGRRPPWWPEDAEWPPKDRRMPGMRRRFLFVVAFALGALLLLIFLAGIVASAIFDGHSGRPGGGDEWNGPPIFGFVILGIGIFLIVRFIRRTAAPIGDVMEAADRVAAGDYAARVDPSGPREVRRLAASFNEMTTRLEANEEQRRRLLADVTHELRTPLSIIRGNVEGMLDGVYPRDEEHLGPVVEETKQMARLLDDLHTLATAEAGVLKLHFEPTDVAELVQDVVTAFAPRAGERQIELTSSVAELPEIEIDPVRIRQVLENVIANALRYTPPGGGVSLDVTGGHGSVTFAIADTGPGVPQETLPQIFDRFAKSSDSGGSGLGLAIAKSLVEAHGGEISADSGPGRGLTVRFELPTASQPTRSREA